MGSAPSTPRPAATVILLRRGSRHRERGVEVLLVRRNPDARFMPGVWVFPGGVVEEGDRDGAGIAADPGGEGREELAHRACAVRELAEEAGIEVGAQDLLPWSRWITPEASEVRFDTRFYVALAPPHSPPRPDGNETVDAGWFAPRRALDLHAAGELELVFPTIKHLESLLPYQTSADVLAAVGRRVEPVLPKLIGDGEERRILLPGEPGYPDA